MATAPGFSSTLSDNVTSGTICSSPQRPRNKRPTSSPAAAEPARLDRGRNQEEALSREEALNLKEALSRAAGPSGRLDKAACREAPRGRAPSSRGRPCIAHT